MLSASISVENKVKAVIVTNRDNLYETYGEDGASELLAKLFSVADDDAAGEVKAVIYYADRYDDMIRDWDNKDCVALYGETPCSFMMGGIEPSDGCGERICSYMTRRIEMPDKDEDKENWLKWLDACKELYSNTICSYMKNPGLPLEYTDVDGWMGWGELPSGSEWLDVAYIL